MKLSLLTLGALAAPLTLAHPVGSAVEIEKRQDNLDVTVLQFALTLEHLENVFYKKALQMFSPQDFVAAGYGANYYNNLQYIAYDEEQHVKFLTAALTAAGAMPVAACTYNFPFTDVSSFITLSTVLEGVGTSAYLGAAGLITNPTYLTAAGAILVTEALHTSYQRAAVKAVPFANPYGTPLDPMAVYTLAAAFIVSCPASNAPLPFTPFPSLTYDGMSCFLESPNAAATFAKRWESSETWSGDDYHHTATATKSYEATQTTEYSKTTEYSSPTATASTLCTPPYAGSTVSFTAASAIPDGSYVTFVSGLMVVSVPGTVDGMSISAMIPAGISGQTYVLVSKSDVETMLDDTAVLFGPAILEVYPPPPTIDYGYAR